MWLNAMNRTNLTKHRSSFYFRVGKRLLDVFTATIGIVILLPVLACVALTVLVTLGTPILFRQKRPGFRGKPFVCMKFRTMKPATDIHGRPLPDARTPDGFQAADSGRVSPVGRFLRSSSLDELPELFNVLRGDMSLVGPRPLLLQYLDRYTPEQARRHDVKPGITGLAQISGRNAISWDERFRLDVWYVDNLSFSLDFKILVKTLWKTVRREGINKTQEVTMEEFMGTKSSRLEQPGMSSTTNNEGIS
jgi:sugar transferase EpsL